MLVMTLSPSHILTLKIFVLIFQFMERRRWVAVIGGFSMGERTHDDWWLVTLGLLEREREVTLGLLAALHVGGCLAALLSMWEAVWR
jgi:hypothetical protein